nr:unnamed protein product [Callosobruchus chinensis]
MKVVPPRTNGWCPAGTTTASKVRDQLIELERNSCTYKKIGGTEPKRHCVNSARSNLNHQEEKMAFKFVAFSCLVAAVNAGFIPQAAAPLAYAAPLAKVAAPVAYAAPVAKSLVSEEYDPHPQYNYGYDIEDHLTGDSKSQHESRDGDVVQGSYSLTDPDGTRRTVDYTADPINGFNAVVRREPIGIVQKAVVAAPAIAKVAAPVAYAAPVAKFAAAPVAYAAPAVAKVAYYH